MEFDHKEIVEMITNLLLKELQCYKYKQEINKSYEKIVLDNKPISFLI